MSYYVLFLFCISGNKVRGFWKLIKGRKWRQNFCELTQTPDRRWRVFQPSHPVNAGMVKGGWRRDGGSEATAMGGMRIQTVQSAINIHLALSLPKTIWGRSANGLRVIHKQPSHWLGVSAWLWGSRVFFVIKSKSKWAGWQGHSCSSHDLACTAGSEIQLIYYTEMEMMTDTGGI